MTQAPLITPEMLHLIHVHLRPSSYQPQPVTRNRPIRNPLIGTPIPQKSLVKSRNLSPCYRTVAFGYHIWRSYEWKLLALKMTHFLDDVRTYFEEYSLPTIGAFKEIRVLDKPEWAKAACIWLQHDDRFDDFLPISFNWIDDEGGIAAVSDDPLIKVQTKPWSYGKAPSWSQFYQSHSWESEDLMRLTICHWVRDCWNKSGSDSFQLPIAIHDQAQCNDYSMELGRFFTSEENWAKLKKG